MVRDELMGGHTHSTQSGVDIHVWRRDGKYLARGKLAGRPIFETLSVSVTDAAVQLRRILSDIDAGRYAPPREARKRPLASAVMSRMQLRDLMNEYLSEKRRTHGKKTMKDYRARLAPVLTFAELPENAKKWRLAKDIDRDFVVKLRAYLHQYKTTRKRSGRWNRTTNVAASDSQCP